MKKIVILVGLILVSGCAGLQQAKDADKPLVFIFDVPGKTKAQLFSTTKSWVAERFVSAKSVIDDADESAGLIIAKGSIPEPCSGLSCTLDYSIGFVMRIDMKDGKMRTTYTSLRVIFPPNGRSLTPDAPIRLQGDLDAAKKGLTALSDDLHKYATSNDTANKNW